MKSWKRTVWLGLLTAIVIGLAAQAQFTEPSQPASPPDSIVQLAAEDQGLEWVAPESLPRNGTFWVVTSNGLTAPYPCFPGNTVLPVYSIVDGIYLVDDTGGQVNPNVRRIPNQSADAPAVSPLEALASTVLNLIGEIQSATELRELRQMYSALGMDAPPDFNETGEGGEYTNQFTSSFVIDTNLLWLELTNVSNGTVHALLHSGTNQFATNQVFAIWTTTNLMTPWQVEAEVWPTSEQTNLAPFTLPTLNREMLFVRSEDWTGKDSNTDGVPDWWLWKYFHRLDLNAANLDSTGLYTLLDDFTNGVDPNVIAFTVGATNDYVNTNTATVQLDVTAGTPIFYAVLINDTNQASANWLPFVTTNLAVSLGATDGVYQVSIGLKGWPADATQTWQDYGFTLDRVAPVLTITNPVVASGTAPVIKPYLQLKGFADEPLASLSYDLNNDLGMATNLDAFVTDQCFDTNRFDFTTNYFQAYDVTLATNDNWITLRVTDRAGNTTTTNFTVTLDYNTATNPVITLTWPTNGMELCGGSFTLRGVTDDEAATVAVTITSTNGSTNLVSGMVERSGVLWVENLPLNNGTNWITLSVTNAAGLPGQTNFYVVKSGMILTITAIEGDLWQPPVTLRGTISESGYNVWANGVKGTNNGDGTWEVTGVPVSAGGVASFDVSAILPGGGDPMINTNVDKEARIVMVEYTGSEAQDYNSTNIGDYCSHYQVTKTMKGALVVGPDGKWVTQDSRTNDTANVLNWNGGASYAWGDVYEWEGAYPLEVLDHHTGYPTDYDEWVWPWLWGDWTYAVLMSIPHMDQTWGRTDGNAGWVSHYFANSVNWQWDLGGGSSRTVIVTARTRLKLYTGGKAKSGQVNLFCVTAGAEEYGKPPGTDLSYVWGGVPAKGIAPSKLRALGKWVGADGKLWVTLPDNASPDLALSAPAKDYNAWADVQKYQPYISLTTSTTSANLETNVPEVCVGQRVTFSLEALPSGDIVDTKGKWSLPGKFVNQETNYASTCTTYVRNDDLLLDTNQTACWFYNTNDGHVSVGLNLKFNNGQYASIARNGDFTVYRPQFIGLANKSFAEVKIVGDRLGVGNGTDATNSGDMSFNVIVQTSVAGNVNCLQLASEDRDYDTTIVTSQCFSTAGQYWLDNNQTIAARHLNPAFTNIPPARYYDSPSLSGQRSVVNVNDKFVTYVQFAPAGSLNDIGDSIYVTLGIIHWNWEGHAQYFDNEWKLIGTNLVSDVTDQPSDIFPVWTDVIINPGNFHLCF